MNSQPVISVRGEARLEVEPEIALLGVTVMAQDKDRRRALKLLAGRTRASWRAARRAFIPLSGTARDVSASPGMWAGLASA